MKKYIYLSACLLANTANAGVMGFVSSPSADFADWEVQVAALSGSVNSNVNFDAMSTGPLDSNFYSISDGVTLSTLGDVGTVQFGAGPGQGNIAGAITGKGLHAPSNFLFDGAAASSLTISFEDSVMAVGLDIIDYFNPSNDNPLTIEAFTGKDGLGDSLGLFSSVANNFQRNNQYFMGLVSTDTNIGSLVFNDVNSVTGDTTGIDNIVFATTEVPEPTLFALFGLAIAGLGFSRKKSNA